MRSTASRSCGPQSQRWLPKTSPVRHSLCGRTSGGSSPRCGGTDLPDRSPSPRARCSRPSTRPSKVNTRAVVAYPSANRSGTVTWVRIVAAGSACGSIGSRQSVPEPGRERVPQQHHVADLAHLGERRAPVRVPREPPSLTNRRARESPTKNGATTRCSSSARSAVRNWVCTVPAALDHQPPHAAGVAGPRSSVPCRPAGRRRRRSPPARAGRGRRPPPRSRSRPASRRRRWRRSSRTGRAAPAGHGDLDRRARQARGRPARPAGPRARTSSRGLSLRTVAAPTRIASQPARTASTRSKSASLDSTQPLLGRAVEVAVDRHAAAEQGVRTVSHARRLPGSGRPAAASGAVRRRGSSPRCSHATTSTTAPGQARDEHHHAEDHGGGDALGRASPAAPNAHAATPSRGPQPAMFIGTAIASSTSSASGSSRAGDAVDPGGPRGDQEGRRRGRPRRRRTRARCPATPAARAARRGGRPQRCARPGPRRERPSCGRTRLSSTAASAPTATAAPRATGIDDRTGDGSSEQHDHREHDLHDLPGGALPGDRPQAQPDVADVAAVAHRRGARRRARRRGAWC